jgi:DNA-binding CsgD family transcriptional regulator
MPAALARVSLALLALAGGLRAMLDPGSVTLPVGVHVAVGWSFAAAGFIAWVLRPQLRMGRLMMLAGAVWFGRDLDAVGAGRLADLSLNVFLALVAHQLVVFPDGRAARRSQRVLIVAAYVLAVGGYALSELVEATGDVLGVLAIVLVIAILFAFVDRWQAATPPARRALVPLVWAGPPVLIVAAATILRDYLDVEVPVLDRAQLVYIAIPLAFLSGVLRVQLRRAELAPLVVELGAVASPREVRAALSRALHDPSLELLFWLPEAGRYVDLDGRRADPAPAPGRAVECVDRGEPLAALVYDASLLDDPGLVAAAAAAVGLALENARLQARLRAQVQNRRSGSLEGPLSELTVRELEVLALIAEGRTDRGIAQQLYVTQKTVETHVRAILRKLDLPAEAGENRRVHAVLAFLRARDARIQGAVTTGLDESTSDPSGNP